MVKEMAMKSLAMVRRINPDAELAYVSSLSIDGAERFGDAKHRRSTEQAVVLQSKCGHAWTAFVYGVLWADCWIRTQPTRVDQCLQPSEFAGVGVGDGVLAKRADLDTRP